MEVMFALMLYLAVPEKEESPEKPTMEVLQEAFPGLPLIEPKRIFPKKIKVVYDEK